MLGTLSKRKRLQVIPRFQKHKESSVETTPLLPLTVDVEPASLSQTRNQLSPPTTTAVSTTEYSIDGYPDNDNSNNCDNIMSASATSPGGSNGRGNPRLGATILGASKKVMSSAMRRPLKSLGRAVNRKETTPPMRPRRVADEDDDDVDAMAMPALVDDEQLLSVNGYGTTSQNNTPVGDDRRGLSFSHRSNHSNILSSPTANQPKHVVDWPAHSMEQFTRTVLLMCAAYTVGAKNPQWTTQVARIAEYTLTAWITCGMILLLGFFQRQFPLWVPGSLGLPPTAEASVVIRSNNLQNSPTSSAVPPNRLSTVEKQTTVPLSTSPSLDVPDMKPIMEARVALPNQSAELPHAHPSLAKLYIVDTATNERLYCNTDQPLHVSTEWFEMDAMIIIRTPDVDDPKADKGCPGNARWSNYVRGKQRRFEFQYQFKLKKVPVGKDLYFSCELEEPIKMGMIQRAFVGAAMAFMKSTNPTFQYSITGSKERTADGKYERPHMSFTVEGSLDRLVVSKPGEKTPQLGTAIEEDPESIKRRKKGTLVDWNMRDTYTMAMWSSYVDFLDWRVINLPGIRPFALTSVLGSQAFYLTMYLIDKERSLDKHYQKDLEYVVSWELGNAQEAEKGPHAIKFTREHPRRSSSAESSGLATDVGGENEILTSRSGDENAGEELEDEIDTETAAELGEGIYMRSGDSVCLQEYSSSTDEEGKGSFVANGGGFAIFQDQDVEIIIEKTRRSKKNLLIKSGDTVMFKMVPRNNRDIGTRYLSIHRGWWLKWVSSIPSKNGFFTISSHDGSSMENSEIATPPAMAPGGYLTMGGPFTLRHKRWSSYFVGVASEPSPTYGGRMLGLHNPENTQNADDHYHSEDGDYDEGDPDLKASKATWMRPLVLTAIEPSEVGVAYASPRKQLEHVFNNADNTSPSSKVGDPPRLTFYHEHAHADVPAWIEMMNRRDRIRQLVYVVRVGLRPKDDQRADDVGSDDLETGEKDTESFFRLRTGRDLAQIMSVGQRVPDFVRSNDSLLHRFRHSGHDTGVSNVMRTSLTKTTSGDLIGGTSPAPISMKRNGIQSTESPQPVSNSLFTHFDSNSLRPDSEIDAEPFEDDESGEYVAEIENADSEELQLQVDDIDEEGEEIEIDSDSDESEDGPNAATKKRRGVVGKSAALIGKSVKATVGAAKLGVKTTKLTGKAAFGTAKLSAKAVKGAGKLTGKAAVETTLVALRSGKRAVSAGKSAVSRKSRNPPKAEPRTKLKDKDQVPVLRSLKKMARREKKKSHAFVAGELCAPEQTRRTASRILSRMSSLQLNAPYWKECNTVLRSKVQQETDQDRWFLEGTSVELGVTPLPSENSRGRTNHGCVVARCLWESHWREEWSGIYDACVSFYAPLSKGPCLEIAYVDITSVRPLAASILSPLPGFPLLVLETAWLCHYVAFHDEVSRDTFGEKVESAIEAHIKKVEATASLQEEDLRKARFWQGFQSLSESSLSTSHGKWAKVSSRDRLQSRAILNGRRMAFDSLDFGDVDMSNKFSFVEDLLSRALSFSLESLEQNPESFIEFLDLTSQLKILPLDEIDPTSKSSVCLFGNLYHCLLQQAMLLSVNGPLHKKSFNHFMRASCYEIGDDVFSLAELYCLVLRGKMMKPSNPKPPYMEAPKKSLAYKHYALDYRDPRLNFVLNCGDVACPRTVPVLRSPILDDQLTEASAIFLQQQVEIDPKRSHIILPKVCEVYKNDFGGDSLSCLKFCIGGLDDSTAAKIRVMMMDQSSLVIRFRPASEQYHTSLMLREDISDDPQRYEV